MVYWSIAVPSRNERYLIQKIDNKTSKIRLMYSCAVCFVSFYYIFSFIHITLSQFLGSHHYYMFCIEQAARLFGFWLDCLLRSKCNTAWACGIKYLILTKLYTWKLLQLLCLCSVFVVWIFTQKIEFIQLEVLAGRWNGWFGVRCGFVTVKV